MNCIICKKELPPEAKFCLECGARQALTCGCGQVLPTDARFCSHCGTMVSYNPVMQPPRMQTMVTPQGVPMSPTVNGYQTIPHLVPYPVGQPTMIPVSPMSPVHGVSYDVYGNPLNVVGGGREIVAEWNAPQSGSREVAELQEPPSPVAPEEKKESRAVEVHQSEMEHQVTGTHEPVPPPENQKHQVMNSHEVVPEFGSSEPVEERQSSHEGMPQPSGTGTHEPVPPPESHVTGTHEPVPPPEIHVPVVGKSEVMESTVTEAAVKAPSSETTSAPRSREIPSTENTLEESSSVGARERAEPEKEKIVSPPEPLLDTPQMVNDVVTEDEVIPPTTTSTVATFDTEVDSVGETVKPSQPKEEKTIYSMFEMGYYGKDLYTDVQRRYGYHQGRLYFKREYELWSSTEEGNDVRLVIPNVGGIILDFAVNSFGIFVWAHEFGVRKFTHTGDFIHTIDVPSHGMIENFAVYGDKVYVVALILVKPETLSPERRGTIGERSEKSLRQRAYIMDFSVKKTRRFEWFPYEFCKVSMISVGEEGFVAKVAYSHTDGNQVTNESGYYYFNTVKDTGICLSHSKVEPHRMMTGWEKYKLDVDELDSASVRGLQIPFIDLPNHRMWVYQTEDGVQWLEARTLEIPELSEVISQVPRWILPENFSEFDLGYSYFDGIRMYHASHYSKFESVLRDGSKRNMIEADNFGHGGTWDFAINHELIYIDLYARGLKQYVAGGQGLIELRRMEHPNTKQNVCFQEY